MGIKGLQFISTEKTMKYTITPPDYTNMPESIAVTLIEYVGECARCRMDDGRIILMPKNLA